MMQDAQDQHKDRVRACEMKQLLQASPRCLRAWGPTRVCDKHGCCAQVVSHELASNLAPWVLPAARESTSGCIHLCIQPEGEHKIVGVEPQQIVYVE